MIKALEDLGATKLHADEQEIVREAADALLFTDSEPEVRQALAELHGLAERLIDSDRLSPEAVERLVRDAEACGPAVGLH